MKPGFVWLWDCVCVLDRQTRREASQAPDWSARSRQPPGRCAEDVWGVIIHCSVQRMLNWTQSVSQSVALRTQSGHPPYWQTSVCELQLTEEVQVLHFNISWRRKNCLWRLAICCRISILRGMDCPKSIYNLYLLFYAVDRLLKSSVISVILVTEFVIVPLTQHPLDLYSQQFLIFKKNFNQSTEPFLNLPDFIHGIFIFAFMYILFSC